MSNQEPIQETAARNLVSYIEFDINGEGYKQLMLFLGICLNDVDIVTRAINLGVDVTEELSNKNNWILSQMGYDTNLLNASERPLSPISVRKNIY
jgi:hypothetical protein